MMGFWKTARGIGGDSWADEMGRCMKKLAQDKPANTKTYGEGKHEITMAEFADLVEFCSRGHIIARVRHNEDSNRPLSELHAKEVDTYSNDGQIHCPPICEVTCGNTG